MLKHSWKITVPITIVVIFGLAIGGYALICSTDFQYRFGIKLKSDTFELQSEINKGQGK